MAKFKITSRRLSDGAVLTHIYDNVTQDIRTDKGIPVALANDPRCKNLVDKGFGNRLVKPNHYKKSFNELRIQLGLGCNFHCKYCIDTHGLEHTRTEATVAMPPKVTAKNFVDLLVKNDIQPKRVVFWGGEPLVYWKTILELVPLIKERVPSVKSFGTITNGSLLTLDKAKFLVENDISVTVSHDGWSFNTYRDDKDPLDNPKVVEALQYYYDHIDEKSKLSFHIVVTPENCDLQKFADYFDKKLDRSPVEFNFESIVKNDRYTKDIITPFDHEARKTLLNNLIVLAGTESENTKFHDLREVTSRFILTLVNKKYITRERFDYPCSAPFSSQVAVDLQGNILKCHGTNPEFSTIGHLNNITAIVNDTLIPSSKRSECSDCPFLALCSGGCPMLEQEDINYYCENLKIWYSGFFAAAWKILFNAVLSSIEPLTEETTKTEDNHA